MSKTPNNNVFTVCYAHPNFQTQHSVEFENFVNTGRYTTSRSKMERREQYGID